ncbi:SDR family oxidoreductase [Shouchella shacheensis]|uniref:SDR family oxidoreductase n=1 Tax=Shouchella shacheensis TaxID=1649580 RepID=UPI00073FD44B|nr:SDR family oxidoreductase [Shouchella shacheensis]
MKKSTALVTGVSHENGIGAAICRELATAGRNIFFAHWQAEEAWPETFRQELEQMGIRAAHMEVDLSRKGTYVEVLDRVEEAIGLPSILVNNAAYSTRDGYERLSAETLDEHYKVNMRATFLLSTEFALRLNENSRKSGRIISMTSGQGQGPMMGELAYVATKGAISAFTLSLSAELAPLGITVNAVNPGPTNTGWMTEGIKRKLQSKLLMGRMGQPGDAARLVKFLVSEEAGWITGQVIHSEGGFYRG